MVTEKNYKLKHKSKLQLIFAKTQYVNARRYIATTPVFVYIPASILSSLPPIHHSVLAHLLYICVFVCMTNALALGYDVKLWMLAVWMVAQTIVNVQLYMVAGGYTLRKRARLCKYSALVHREKYCYSWLIVTVLIYYYWFPVSM